ncbi:hypothetical protein TNCV_1204341 [Trichonephila clavipes]|nr:hypothetical protein TNCV_1204341 [Trichonephila clavipes]
MSDLITPDWNICSHPRAKGLGTNQTEHRTLGSLNFSENGRFTHANGTHKEKADQQREAQSPAISESILQSQRDRSLDLADQLTKSQVQASAEY